MKNYINIAFRYIVDQDYRFFVNSDRGLYNCISDREYIEKRYFHKMHSSLNLDNPVSFNEKLQWLKLNDRKPIYTEMVDKLKAKSLVSEIIGDSYTIPTYGYWDRFCDIDFDSLPNQFVLKCSHDSGGVVICKDKESFDYQLNEKVFKQLLSRNFFYYGREWPYKNVEPRIIAEEYLGENLNDYKFFCFNGSPEICLVCSERSSDTGMKEDFYNLDWNHLDMKRPGHDNSSIKQEQPSTFGEMITISKKISKNIPFVRVDLYEVNGKCYFGELTFFPASGFLGFEPSEWDTILGNMLTLPDKE